MSSELTKKAVDMLLKGATLVSEPTLEVLEKKLEKLSQELESEKNHEKQQEILKSINSLVEIIKKLKN